MSCCLSFFRRKSHNKDQSSMSLHKLPADLDAKLLNSPDKTEEKLNHYEKNNFVSHQKNSDTETNPEEIKEESNTVIIPPPKIEPDFESLFNPGFSVILPITEEVQSKTQFFENLLAMETDKSWKLKDSKTFAKIYLKKGSEEYPELPMVKALFDMEINASPEELYFLLYDVETRKTWDKASVGEYVEIYKTQDVVGYYMLNKAPWPFADRDFIERRYIRKRDNGDIEIYYCQHDEPDYQSTNKKAERGKTIFGGQIIRKRISKVSGEPTLLVTMISQADMNGKIPAKALRETLPASLIKWYRSVRKELVKNISISRTSK